MKSIAENSWITSDGMIWLQVYSLDTATDILFSNSFELFIVHLQTEVEYSLCDYELEDAEKEISRVITGPNTDQIVCIPVGKVNKISPTTFRLE